MNCIIKSWLMLCIQKLGHWFNSFHFISLALVNRFLTHIVVFVANLYRAWINHRAHQERIFTHAWESPIMDESTLNANESRNRRDAIWFAAAPWLHLIKANEYCLIDNNNAFAKSFLSFRFWLWYDFQYPNMSKHKNELWINWVDHELFNIIFCTKANGKTTTTFTVVQMFISLTCSLPQVFGRRLLSTHTLLEIVSMWCANLSVYFI